MITNSRQYRITRARLKKLRRAIDAFDITAVAKKSGSRALARAELDALRSEQENMAAQVREYDALASGTVDVVKATSLEELPLLLIKARIARGLSQRELAERLGMKEQQIQRYESEMFRSASLPRLAEVARALDVSVSEVVELRRVGPTRTGAATEGIAWDMFPVDEMYRRGWFEGFTDTLDAAKANSEELLRHFVSKAVREPVPALLRRRVRSGGRANPYALFAWQCRVLTLAKSQEVAPKFRKSDLDEGWFHTLARKSSEDTGPRHARDYLLDSGIRMVVEPHLTHTHLDGAALLLSDGSPVVGLTVRYDRLDNFWFVLFHELAHIAKHLRKGRLEDVLDDLDAEPDDLEKEADAFAGDMLLSDTIWETALARYFQTKDSINELASELQISPAIIAGRIRRESGNYTLFAEMIGQGEVRKQFGKVKFAQ